MVALPGGAFTMGDRGDAVAVAPFCLDATPVTAAAYSECVRAGACGDEGLRCGAAATYLSPGKANHPINCVDDRQAETYCRSHGDRLPTEEEWEWAARGGPEGRTYPWGSAPPAAQLCWSGREERRETCAVGSFPAGDAPGPLHDMAANVFEWTATPAADLPDVRVLRGATFLASDPAFVRAASRSRGAPTPRTTSLGFRCARSSG